MFSVVLSKNAKKDLLRVPTYIVIKLQAWVDSIKHNGLNETRKMPGFHDEPLKGSRMGQRSIRLNKGYRAIYGFDKEGSVQIIKILEVNKHDY